ncbi:MAG: methyltransferase domain-containing protein [Pirellulales bacterium]|nr:methyltransferase domain-containing protein [Pirellulales bacterium]
MPGRLSEHGLFFKEFLRNFHTTGAILPSGRFLAAALARFVTEGAAEGRKILEVGPGTGPVTRRIVAGLGPDDRLDLVELNESFVRQLRHRFETDEAFRAVADRSRVLHCPVEDLRDAGSYDLIISGLPLNNFSGDAVRQILATLTGLLKAGGTLSFFEYIAVRRARALISGRAERARLRGIGQAMQAVLGPHEIRRDWVWPNVPPAWVHHVRPS